MRKVVTRQTQTRDIEKIRVAQRFSEVTIKMMNIQAACACTCVVALVLAVAVSRTLLVCHLVDLPSNFVARRGQWQADESMAVSKRKAEELERERTNTEERQEKLRRLQDNRQR